MKIEVVGMKVVAIGGSPRVSGNTNYLMDRVLDELVSRGMLTEVSAGSFHYLPGKAAATPLKQRLY